MKKLLLLLLFILSKLSIYGQDSDISTQRPTLSESYHILSNHTLQLENGYTHDFGTNDNTYNTFVRHSLFESIELRVNKNYTTGYLGYGGKIIILPEKSYNGLGVSFIYNYNEGEEYKIAFSKSFGRVELTANTTWNRKVIGGRYNNISVNYWLTPQMFINGEVQINGNSFNNLDKLFQSSLVYVINKDIQLDSFVGYSDNIYAGGGLSIKIYYGKKERFNIEEVR